MMEHRLVIVGAGGFGRDVLSLVADCFPQGCEVRGFLDQNPASLDGFHLELPILGDPAEYVPRADERLVLAIGDPKGKRHTVEKLRARGAEFATMIHPTAFVSRTARMGAGAVIYPFTAICNCAKLGDFVHLNFYASVGHDVTVGNFCTLSPYSTLNGMSAVEDEVFLGTRASVAVGRRVGARSQLSSHTAAMHDVLPDSFVHGVPGRQTRGGQFA